jgi:hypothetical protein
MEPVVSLESLDFETDTKTEFEHINLVSKATGDALAQLLFDKFFAEQPKDE